MKRREFIRLGGFLTVSVAAMGMTGCDIVGENDDTSASALDPTLYPTPVRPMPAAAAGANWYFPQSVASGDPKSDSIILWTRLLDTGAASATAAATLDAAITLKVTKADNSSLLGTNTAIAGTLVADVTVPAYVDYDGTIRHKLTGLDPDAIYYYQFTAGTVLSRVGRFKTAPAANSTRTVKFAFMSCQDWSSNHWGAFSHIVAQDVATPADLDFVVHLGDYIYETDNAGAAGAEAGHGVISFPTGADLPPERTTGPALPADPPGMYATTTADYRHLYKLYRSDSRIQAMHERFPMVAVWDDHEFSDDAWMNAETYTNQNAAQFERRRSANQAWFEFMPADVTFQETNPSFQNIQLYRDLKFGQTMHLVMTDERLYKQDHLIPENTQTPGAPTGMELGRINSRYLVPESTLKLVEGIKDAASPNMTLLSILGATQRDWWKSTMLNSSSTWKVWGNEVSLLRMGLHGTNALSTLIPLGAISSLASSITTTATNFGAPVPFASAVVAAIAFGALTPGVDVAPADSTAVKGATAIATVDGMGGDAVAKTAAAEGQGLSAPQAAVAVAAFDTAKATAVGGGTSAQQAAAAAQLIAIGYGQPDMLANKSASAFFLAMMKASDLAGGLPVGTTAPRVAGFFQKFVLNADQWDGYRKERTALMNHLIDNNIQNVVAVTGDIHAFFAGTVYNEFPGEVLTVGLVGTSAVEATASTGGTAAMVDLVTAGVSSTSWFTYLKAAADGLDPANALIGKLVYVPIPIAFPSDYFFGGSPAVSFTANLNLLDFTMGKVLAGSDDTERATTLAAQMSTQIKAALGAAGFPEMFVDSIAAGIQAGVAGSPTFASAVGLAKALSALGAATNPWLSGSTGHVDTEAQGYAVVEASTSELKCYFHKLNPIVGTAAPTASRVLVPSTTQALITAGTAAVTISTLV